MNRYLTVKQVSEILNLHPVVVRRYIKEGTIPAIMLKKGYRISEKDLEEFLESVSV